MSTDPLADAAERFAKDTAGHELTILHEDGLYRHLRFRKPAGGYSEYWFDLITWPGVLVIRGDMETFAFSRCDDMFGLFRGHRVNPGYWGEKLIAPKSRDVSVRRYSEEGFRRLLTDIASESEDEYPGLGAALTAKFTGMFPDWDTSYEEAARAGLNDFEFGAAYAIECSCGQSATGLTSAGHVEWKMRHDRETGYLHPQPKVEQIREPFRFRNTWDWDLTDWSYQYLWCCHAIVSGIGLYDAAKTEQVKVASDVV